MLNATALNDALDQLLAGLAKHVPAGWELRIEVRNEEASFELINEDGVSPIVVDDDLDSLEQLVYRINVAREAEGLAGRIEVEDILQVRA